MVSERERAIENLIIPLSGAGTEIAIPEPRRRWYSAGIHPWYTSEEQGKAQLMLLETIVADASIKMVGECGLDRIKGPELSAQMRLFELQLGIAEKIRKPVLIHCVKCYNELFEVTSRVKPSIPLILHGFNSKLEVGRQLINKGFYLSLGAAILKAGSNAANVLKLVPLNQLFLENDDSNIPVETIYQRAAALKNLSVNMLEEAIFANYSNLGV